MSFESLCRYLLQFRDLIVAYVKVPQKVKMLVPRGIRDSREEMLIINTVVCSKLSRISQSVEPVLLRSFDDGLIFHTIFFCPSPPISNKFHYPNAKRLQSS